MDYDNYQNYQFLGLYDNYTEEDEVEQDVLDSQETISFEGVNDAVLVL